MRATVASRASWRALAMCAAVVLGACSPAPAATAPASAPVAAPSATIGAPASQAAVATPARTATASVTFPPRGTVAGTPMPIQECCVGAPLAAGRYVSPEFIPLAMSVAIGEGWNGYANEQDGLFTFVRGKNAVLHATQWLVFAAVPANRADGFLDALRATPLLDVGAGRPIDAAGLHGQRFDAVALPNPGEQGGPNRVPGSVEIRAMGLITNIPHGWTTETQEARLSVSVLEVAPGLDVVVYVEAPATLFDDFAAEADGILETLQVALG